MTHMKAPIVLYEPSKRARTDYGIGLSAWTDKSMLEEGTFYPYKTMSAEERLWSPPPDQPGRADRGHRPFELRAAARASLVYRGMMPRGMLRFIRSLRAGLSQNSAQPVHSRSHEPNPALRPCPMLLNM